MKHAHPTPHGHCTTKSIPACMSSEAVRQGSRIRNKIIFAERLALENDFFFFFFLNLRESMFVHMSHLGKIKMHKFLCVPLKKTKLCSQSIFKSHTLEDHVGN